MSFVSKPSWLKDYNSLKETVEHQLFMPANIPSFTTLTDPTYFNAGMKQFLFWKGQLLPSSNAQTVFIALLGPNGLKPINVIDITTAISQVCNLSQVIEFYQGANTCFLAISFISKEPITKIVSQFKFFDDSIVLTITHDSTPHYRFRLLWLPPLFDEKRVHHLLNRYTKTHRIRRESIALAGGVFSPTNVIAGTFTLEPGGDITKLPHLIQLPSPHKGCALLSISSRPPLCLKCRAIGHTRLKCPMVKCVGCTKVHFPSSPCGQSSYSSIASRNITASTEDDWLASLADHSTISDSETDTHDDLITVPSSVAPLSDTSDSPQSTTIQLHSNPQPIDAIGSAKCDRTWHVSTGDSHPPLPLQDPFSSTHTNTIIPSAHITSHTDQPPSKILAGSLSVIPANTFVNEPLASHTLDIPVATFKYNKVSTKAKQSPHPAPVTRSHLITYSTASKLDYHVIPKSASLSNSDTIDAIFGDPKPETFLSSDAESNPEPSNFMDFSDSSNLDPTSRKRKISASSSEPVASASPHSTLEDAFSDSSNASLASSKSSLISPLASLEQPIINIDPGPSQLRQTSQLQIAAIFKADLHHVAHLERLCPNGNFTADIIKACELLVAHGFYLSQIVDSPQVFKLRLPELRRKLKFLLQHLGSFTLEDLFKQHSFEDQVFVGTIIT